MSGWGDIFYLFGENEKLRTHIAEAESLCDRLAVELTHFIAKKPDYDNTVAVLQDAAAYRDRGRARG